MWDGRCGGMWDKQATELVNFILFVNIAHNYNVGVGCGMGGWHNLIILLWEILFLVVMSGGVWDVRMG